jgi:hypothetical protein
VTLFLCQYFINDAIKDKYIFIKGLSFSSEGGGTKYMGEGAIVIYMNNGFKKN